MNKTVNINLAGTFFHIDENAYSKLQRYLESIKRSFTDSQGQSEIISDIEARISELFSERLKTDNQVVGVKEVDDVITIMGQPEDYLVDDEIFEDNPNTQYSSRSTRKFFRDKESAYIGGVSSGIAHYFGVDALWIRIAWVFLFIFGGTGFLLYILLWILMPVAQTTSEKLAMTGKPVNITNIEQKVKEGFSNVGESIEGVTDKIANADYSKVKSGTSSFFDAIGNVFMFFFKIIAKFIGIILIIVGLSGLLASIVAFISGTISSAVNIQGIEYAHAVLSDKTPLWLLSLLLLFVVGIIFFFIFYLGLKILIKNLKSIGNIAKFSLIGIWFVAFFSLITLGLMQGSEYSNLPQSETEKQELAITANDTLTLKMQSNSLYYNSTYRNTNSFYINYNENDQKVIVSRDVRLIVKSTKDSLATISIRKRALGRNYELAKERATSINYNYTFKDNILLLDGYLTTDYYNDYRGQEVEITLYLPEGTTLIADSNTYSFHSNPDSYNDILKNGTEGHLLKVIDNELICLDCEDENYKLDININNEKSGLKIDEDGVEINGDDVNITINGKGVKANSETVKVNIDEDGIEIKSEEKSN